LNGKIGTSRMIATMIAPWRSVRASSRRNLSLPSSQRDTASRANQRARAKAPAAPSVDPILTSTTPVTDPNIAPAATVRTEAGSATVVATP
jgi:hypothetical protein